MVAANPATSPVTGWPVGFWWSELTHPWHVFAEHGWQVELRSPAGGRLEGDAWSDPEHESGYAADDFVSRGFKHSPRHRALLEDTASIDGVDPADHDALFVVGGQSPMVTFPGNRPLQDLVAAFHGAGRPTALVCHATCLLLETRDAAGRLLVEGRRWTGFTDAEEEVADQAVGQPLQPFRIETEARRLTGTEFVVGAPFTPFAVRDGHLITGQQQASGALVARRVVEAVTALHSSEGARA
jgi:putative intracellular protease/amidase